MITKVLPASTMRVYHDKRSYSCHHHREVPKYRGMTDLSGDASYLLARYTLKMRVILWREAKRLFHAILSRYGAKCIDGRAVWLPSKSNDSHLWRV